MTSISAKTLQAPIAHVCDMQHAAAIHISFSKKGMRKPCPKRADIESRSGQIKCINFKKMPTQFGDTEVLTHFQGSSILIPATQKKTASRRLFC